MNTKYRFNMISRMIAAHLMFFALVYGTTPAKPGVIPSERLIQQTAIMAETYTQGGLAAKMQRVRAANIQAAQNGLRDLREDVYGSFPVILGSYIDSDDNENVVEQLQRQLFDGPWPTITMAEHYEQMSYGQYHLAGTVYGWYELSQTGFHYGGTDNGFDGGVGDFLTESLNLADIEIDFTQYDNDGDDGVPNSGDDDGYVDAAFFVHSGRGGESGGPHIWSHRWTYSGATQGSAFETNDIGANGEPIRVQDYIMQPAVAGGSQSAGGLIQIGVFSHEFGHALGLPDLYDTDYSSNGIGSWCLMASGSWSTPTSPVHFSAWCKEMMGWTIPLVADQNFQNFEIPNAEENPFAVKLWTHGVMDSVHGHFGAFSDLGQRVAREYYLVENRQRLGSEQSLPGTGLVIWHIDNSITTNSNENHRMVDVKAADNQFNGSNAGDSWPGMTDNRNFDYETLPSSVGWTPGVNTEVAVLNISDSGPTMWADIEVFESNPHLKITDKLVVDFNGDNIFAPGENVLIWLIVQNTGAQANNATATLSFEGDAVELIDSVMTFDPVDFMGTSTSNQAFEFNINDTLSPQSVRFEVRFDSDESLEPSYEYFDLLLGTPNIVVIDDDGAEAGTADYQEYFTEALQAAELVHVVWDVSERGLPELEWLDDFPSAIWFSGDNQTPLDQNSTGLISEYLDGGGNMLLTGQNIATGDMTVNTFVQEYLKAEVLANDINTVNVYSDPGHEFFDVNDRFSIGSDQGANNQTASDSYRILDGASSMFMYPTLGMVSCGVSVKNQTYSAVMLGFGLEALTHFDNDSRNSRGEIIGRILDWMQASSTSIKSTSPLIPQGAGIVASYPNPFNPSISFEVALSQGVSGIMQIMDVRGAVVETIEIQHSGQVSWKPSAHLAGGIYFARILIDAQPVGNLVKVTYLK